MNTSRTTISLMGFHALLLVGIACVVGVSTAVAATPTSRAVHAFLQGGDVDAQLEDRSAPDRDLRVNVWHDREDDETYRRGEAVNVNFRTNADMYVVVYRLDTDGRVEVLWPTTRYDDGFVYGNHSYSLPRPGSPIRLRASQLRGVEYVEAIASEYPFDLRNLAIDFRFDPDSRGDYDYQISGDPFLALNDINFAITGLESDVDYVVTDWAHLYVESKVEYARYACRQCHDQDDDYHPYVDKCSTVNIYSDWGWQSNWYGRFGWYPLYYEPPYYYWDVAYARPYWYSYYPIVYDWPTFGVYARPYPVYWWYDSPYSYVDYRVRYKKNWRYYRPLYDLDSARVRGATRDFASSRSVNRSPASMRDGLRGRGVRGRVSEDRLVRSRMPERTHRGDLGPTVTTRRSGPRITDRNDPRRGGVRTDLTRRSEARRLRSLPSVRTADRPRAGEDRGERRWTRPVTRSREDTRGRSEATRDRSGNRGRSEATRDRSGNRGRSEAKRDRSSNRGRSEAKRDRSSNRGRSEAKRDRGSRGRQDVQPPQRSLRSSGDRKVKPTRRSGSSRGNERSVQPSRRGGSNSKSSSPSRSSRSGGSRSKGGKRGGRG